jgi:ferredoxin-NADP reductase
MIRKAAAERSGAGLAGPLLCLALLGVSGAALAQADPADHASHHPGGGAPAAPPATAVLEGAAAPTGPPPALATGGQAGAGCGGMGGGGAKPFYPALMDMPTLTPEARRFIEAEASRRLGTGSEAITTGQAPLHQAVSANDPAAMQLAVSGVREGVLQVESGASALRAVNEGQPPRQIALAWFKGQTSTPDSGGMAMGDGPWGLSWYHLTTMTFLLAFLLGAILIHFARTQRIGGLVERLTPGGAAAAPPSGTPGAASATPAPAAAGRTPAPKPSPEGGTAPAAAPPQADGPKKPWSGALRVADIFRETPAVKTFRLRGLDGGYIPFSFMPGQFLTFSAKVDDRVIKRSYTIASSPAQGDYVEVTVKREEQGVESRYLHDHVAVGDHLEVSGPSGVFTFTGKETDSIVLISGGVGITPMMCILRYLTDCGYPGEVFFLHGARTAQDIIFREELAYLQKRHANVRVIVTIGDYEDAAWPGLTGHVSKEMIAQSVPGIARRRVHVCGPPGMMAAVKATLLDLGVPGDKIKTEAFGPAKGAAPAPEPKAAAPTPAVDAAPAPAPAPSADAAAPAPPASAAAAAPSAQVEVQFKKSGKTGPLAPDKCVLEAAEAIGVAIDFQCRVGTCGTCVVPLLQGAVTMEEESGLLPEDKARGIILACQAKSAMALVVDA